MTRTEVAAEHNVNSADKNSAEFQGSPSTGRRLAHGVASRAPATVSLAPDVAAAIANGLATADRRAFVFIGEAGAGKSELAVNLALALSHTGRAVQFFDLDQTKPLFRSREMAAPMRAAGIKVGGDHQMLDARTIPHGLLDHLRDDAHNIVLDIGGDAQGAVMLGQFAEAWGGPGIAAFLVVNPYRAFATDAEHLAATIADLRRVARLPSISVIANPNFGGETQAEDVIAGVHIVERALAGTDYAIEAVGSLARFAADVRSAFPSLKILPITRYIVPLWEGDGATTTGDIA